MKKENSRFMMMNMKVALWMLMSIFLTLSVSGKEIKPISDALLAKILASAPQPPLKKLDLGLKVRLIDYIDCTNPEDPHDFLDQGTSKVDTGPAGKYRVTAKHRAAFFSYAYKTAGADKPILIVIEYPDDAKRRMCFLTHDAKRSPVMHRSFSLESGVYSGYPLPLSNKMQYFTYLTWPQDDWSPLVITNFARSGSRAAASRIWIYAVDEIPPLEGFVSDGKGRRLELFYPLDVLALRDNFGWKSKNSIKHLVDYCRWIGVNRVTMMLFANTTWGASLEVPAWDVDPKKNRGSGTSFKLKKILETMDAKGGDVGLIVGIVADGMYGVITHEGKPVRDLSKEKQKEILCKGFDEIIEKYGSYKSFKGFSFGSMEATGFLESMKEAGILEEVVAHIKKRRPDLDIITYVGTSYLQAPFFYPHHDLLSGAVYDKQRQYPSPTALKVILDWEKKGGDFEQHLADQIAANWKTWNLDPNDTKKASGILLYEKKIYDDYLINQAYRNEPRSMIYYDVVKSQKKSDLVDTPWASIFGTFDEGWIGLTKGYNFWYTKPWIAPEFNPAGNLAIDAWSTHLAHRDRLGIMAGSWCTKTFGMESVYRRFAKAFLALPAVELDDVSVNGCDGLVARWKNHNGKRYVNVINRMPFPVDVSVDGKMQTIRGYGIYSWVQDKAKVPVVKASYPKPYIEFVQKRLKDFQILLSEVRKLDPAAAPDVYKTLLAQSQKYADQSKWFRADQKLSYGLENELKLRRRILAPPPIEVKRIDSPIVKLSDPESWPKTIPVIEFSGDGYLQSHTYFPNSWHGNDDLSCRMRLAHDGKEMYFLFDISDDISNKKDGCTLWLSHERYKDWSNPEELGSKLKIPFGSPGKSPISKKKRMVSYTIEKTAKGYRISGHAPMKKLKVTPGGKKGFLLTINDCDNAPSRAKKKPWAKKQVMHYPYAPTFKPWIDVRNSGELHFEK